MGVLNRWTAVITLAAGAGSAAAVSRRLARGRNRVPRMAGVDGLGEPLREEPAPLVADIPTTPSALVPAAAVFAGPEANGDPGAAPDAIAALDEARDRLRRRADELRQEIADGGA